MKSPLRPGAFVRLKMPDKSYKAILSIPETALYEDEYIFIVNDQRLKKIMVQIIGYDESKVLVKPLYDSQIKNGDFVVINQLREAGEDVKVDII